MLVGVMFASMLLLILRYWLLPDIGKFRHEIAAAITRVTGQPVHIDGIHANWDGLRPHLSLQGIRISDPAGNPVLAFAEIKGTISWRSVLRGELNFHRIVIDRPALITRRDTDGHLHVAGIMLNKTQQKGGFFDWLLRQRQLIINQAMIYWQDDLRGAPVLYLESVSLHLENRRGGRRHRFGLRVLPPKTLASRIDIRGDFTGESIRALSAWEGRLFIQLQDADLVGWQTWMTLPGEQMLKHGKGAVRAWMNIGAGNLAGWIADVSLHDAAMHFAQHLPLLEIDRLRGRLGQRKIESTRETGEVWFAHHLSIGLRDQPLTRPATIAWRKLNRKTGGEFTDNSVEVEELDVEVFAGLVAYLPVESSLREFLSELSPKGMVEHADFEWQGAWSENPLFRINGSFRDLAVQSFSGYPSFSGISGSIDATETSGSLSVSSKKLVINKTGRPEEALLFDMLTGRVNWKMFPDREITLLRFDDVAFASKGGAGIIHGRYSFGGDTPEQIDLTGNLARADIVHLKQYVAWMTGKAIQDQISEAVVAGHLNNTKFHVKGALNDKSLEKGHGLSIQAETAIKHAVVRVSEEGPEIADIAGKLSLQHDSLDIFFSTASFSGIRLKDFKLQVIDLYAENPIVKVKSVAEGETGEMITLVRKIPLDQHTDELLSQIKMSGQGRLQVDMTVPVNQHQEFLSAARMKGHYQFIDNQINLGRYVPDLYQVNGMLIFTESSVVFDKFHAQALGGAVEISSTSLPDGGIRISANGYADFDRLQPDIPVEPTNLSQLWIRFMRGGTDWRATIDIGGGKVGIVVESLLEGMESLLPAPFTKTAAEIVPVRFEKYFTRPQDDLVRFRCGEIMMAEFQRIREKAYHYHPVRGVISFGSAGKLPEAPGTRIDGVISRLEWDQWRELFKRHGEIDASSNSVRRGLDNILTESTQFDLRIGEFEFLGSYFNDSALTIDKQGKNWQMHVSSQEVTGEIDWYEAMPQKVVARLTRLVMPETAQEPVLIPRRPHQPRDWPDVDIEADALMVKGILLGQLKLEASQQDDGWHIENLDIEHPDSRLQAKGIWQNRRLPFRVYSNIQLQSSNVGKFLERYGYPDRIARGEGSLEGNLEWAGKPFSIDFPSSSGNLDIIIQRGQFTKLKPGIGRLLGIFDLKSLPRRLTFDFYDIFGKGFGFDDVRGSINIEEGIASTDELNITGSAASLTVSGKWNLVEETQSLNLKVFPSLGLVTPIAGIAAMIATQTLQDPFNPVLFSEYAITGKWNKPVVIKLDKGNDSSDQLEYPKTGSE